MRIFLIILLITISGGLFAQSDSIQLTRSMKALEVGLLRKDSVLLRSVLHEKLVYGHSNGWIEKKQDVIDDLFNGTLTYRILQQYQPQIIFEGDMALVRSNPDIEVLMKGTPVKLKLHVLQVWVKTNKNWQLISRQSTKIN
jgi:hypothetical protein